MKKPTLHINPVEIDIPDEWTEYLWELFKPRIEVLIAEKTGGSAGNPVDTDMPVSYFTEKHKMSKVTFYKIVNQSNLKPSFTRVRLSYYGVEKFKKAFQAYRPEKPLIKRSFLKTV